MATPVNPDQQMVDNATSALASRNANIGGRRRSPGNKQRDNGRMGAIGRRLANMKRN